MKTIVVANQKGGTGKTTTAVTLASGFAGLDKTTLLIDTDAQGNCSHFLGLEPVDDLLNVLVLNHGIDANIKICVLPNKFHNLDILRSSIKTRVIEVALSSDVLDKPPQSILSDALLELGDTLYDFCIIDTAPSLSSIQEAALYAADYLIIPAIPEYASEAGIAQLAQTVQEIEEPVALLGILPMKVDLRINEHVETIHALKETFGEDLVLPSVRELAAIKYATREGIPIWWHEPEGKAAQDFARVLEEVQRRV